METQINYLGIDLIVKGNYEEGEEEIFYGDDGVGYPGSRPCFDIREIYVIDSIINIIDLFEGDFDEITDLCLTEICQ